MTSGPRPRRRVVLGSAHGPARILATGLLMSLLSACLFGGPAKGAWYGDATDVQRAQAIWTDPWAAPTSTRVAGFHDVASGAIQRRVGMRAVVATSGATAAAAVSAEVRAATATRRWVLIGAACASETGSTGVATAWLSRIGEGLESAATAVVSAHAYDDGSGSGTVVVTVPDHLDRGWPRGTALDLATTCLAGGSVASIGTQPSEPGYGIVSDQPVDSRDLPQLDPPEWSTPGPPSDLAEIVRGLSSDPLLARLDIVPRLPGQPINGWGERDAALHSVTPLTSPGALPGLVEAARSGGWQLTYAACAPAPGAVTAELQRAAGPSRYAVLRLTGVRTRGGDATTATVVSVAGLVSSSLSAPAAPAISGQPCWVTPPAGTGSEAGASVAGTPAFGPTLIQPLTGLTVSQ